MRRSSVTESRNVDGAPRPRIRVARAEDCAVADGVDSLRYGPRFALWAARQWCAIRLRREGCVTTLLGAYAGLGIPSALSSHDVVFALLALHARRPVAFMPVGAAHVSVDEWGWLVCLAAYQRGLAEVGHRTLVEWLPAPPAARAAASARRLARLLGSVGLGLVPLPPGTAAARPPRAHARPH